MTGEEQLMIDGTDCYFKQLARKTQECELAERLIAGILKTLNLEAYDWRADQNEIITEIKAFKQECEELKEYARRQENQRETYYKEFLKKDKALEEIEEVINNILNSCLGRNTVGCRPTHNVCGDLIKILNIINKAKGEECN